MKNLKVVEISEDYITFENGIQLYSAHDQDCCESHFLDFKQLAIEDFEGLLFNLSDDNFFEEIEGYGIALLPINGHPVRIPGYGWNNGYYSSNLSLILSGDGLHIEYDISDCQEITD